MNPPKHVAIIMDGNGRWGIKKKKSRKYGHKKGIETVEKIISAPVQQAVSSSPSTYPKASEIISGEIKVSPLAKKLAQERGLNLKFIKGTGTEGRIIKRDIDNYQVSGSNFSGVESFTDYPVTQMRKVIAQRLAESKFTAPHFYLSMSIDMDNAIAARISINNIIKPQKVSFNDMVVKAVAASLKDNPQVNASWLGDVIVVNQLTLEKVVKFVSGS